MKRHNRTIRKWRNYGWLVPSESFVRGQQEVHLYTEDDVRKALKLAATKKAGRPAKEKDVKETTAQSRR